MFDDFYPRFPKSTPRAAKGGIRAQSKRGSFGESWWAKRWMEVLHSFDIGARLSRGRSYARNGQVLSIDIAKGQIKSRVQGSRPSPYEVTMQVKTLGTADWKKVADAISAQALFTAKLLRGEMPAEIEQAFKDSGISLFPAKLQDLRTDCSCPDWSNPCKHVAAVYCLLAEEFDRDPFLIFRMRGISRDEFGQLLADSPVKAVPAAEPIPPEPLPADPAAFWAAPVLRTEIGEARTPTLTAALVRRLGNIPFWRGQENFMDAMEALYSRASAKFGE